MSNNLIRQDQIIPGTIKQRHLCASSTIANGDLYYGDGNNNFVRIPTGVTNGFLSIVNGIPSWSNTLSIYANNAAALAGGLVVGSLYRTGANPDVVCIVH